MYEFEIYHTFPYKDNNIEIGYHVDGPESDLRGDIAALDPIRTAAVHINYEPILAPISFYPTLPEALQSGDYAKIDEAIQTQVDEVR